MVFKSSFQGTFFSLTSYFHFVRKLFTSLNEFITSPLKNSLKSFPRIFKVKNLLYKSHNNFISCFLVSYFSCFLILLTRIPRTMSTNSGHLCLLSEFNINVLIFHYSHYFFPFNSLGSL